MRRGALQILALLFGLITSPTHAQSLWQWQHPEPQGNSPFAVDILAPSMAIAVGPLGTVLTSSDAGITWTAEREITGLPQLQGVCIVDANTVVAVGLGGVVYRSTDAGETWQAQTSGTMQALFDVDFANDLVGTAVGSNGTILRSTDGGITWNPQTSGSAAVLFGVRMFDANVGTAVGTGGTILRTTDGGATWSAQTSGTSEILYGVDFVDANTGMAVGVGPTILGTMDGGATWVVQYPSMPPPWATLYAVWMTSATHGFAVGGEDEGYSLESTSVLMRTINGGATWIMDEQPTQLYGVAMFNSTEGVAVGGAGMIRRTTDGGLSWPQIAGGLQRYFMRGVDFFDLQHGAAVSYEVRVNFPSSRTYLTGDGGLTWTVASPFTGDDMSDIAFADASTIYAVGHGVREMDAGAVIKRSTDGGVTWAGVYGSVCFPPPPIGPPCIQDLNAVDFAGPNAGVAVGIDGAIITILNGSATEVSSPTTEMLRGVSVPTPQTAYAVGGNGVILKGNLVSGSWVQLASGTSQFLSDVFFTDALTGTVVGALGTVLRTTDGGSTWTPQVSGTTTDLESVSFLDADNGIIGASGMLLKTIDGGASWAREAVPLGWDDYRSAGQASVDVAYIDPTTVTAVGGHENIISRRDIPVAILFQDFSARAFPSSVELRWTVQPDGHIRAFRVYRSVDHLSDPGYASEPIAPSERSFVDENVVPGATYVYMLTAIDARGSESRSQTIAVSVPRAQVALFQNHPNPFNPTTRIRFELPERMHVQLSVYDTAGRKIATLLDGYCPRGQQVVTWNGTNFLGKPAGAGTYYCELRTRIAVVTRKMTMVK